RNFFFAPIPVWAAHSDYFALSGGIGPVSAGTSFEYPNTEDPHGNTYYSGGVSLESLTSLKSPGISLMFGSLVDYSGRGAFQEQPTGGQVSSFMTGPTLGVQICEWVCAGVGRNNSGLALEFGLGTPGFGIGFTDTVRSTPKYF